MKKVGKAAVEIASKTFLAALMVFSLTWGLTQLAVAKENWQERKNMVEAEVDGRILLKSAAAKIVGPGQARFNVYEGVENIGWWDYATQSLSWRFVCGQTGDYRVEMQYALPRNVTEYEIAVSDQKLSGRVEGTGGWNRWADTAPEGILKLEKGGEYALELKATKVSDAGVMNLGQIRLIPVEIEDTEPKSIRSKSPIPTLRPLTADEKQTQKAAAEGMIKRLLGETVASKFVVAIIPAQDKLDVFEVESIGEKIILRGSSGVSVGRALKWYLNHLCHCSLSWHGDNLNLPEKLPEVAHKHREATPFQYRFMFNYCTFGYSMAWWHWSEWERTIDFLAFNGINLPLCPLGQEKVWQETYKEFGLTPKDLESYFAGIAWQPWQWMACLDGWGGPLPQSVIDKQAKLQERILERMRSLGMKSVLMGFSGHVPRTLKEKVFPDLKVHGVDWQGFKATLSLDPDDPRFREIGKVFMEKQTEIFGTDHYYSIDPFIEMIPPSMELSYRAGMAKKIFEAMDDGDPEGIWVMQTWFCKSPQIPGHPWPVAQTKAFFDAVPDDRVLALELHGDSWHWTGWKHQSGWYNKPWIWNIVQNFGDQVDIFGGLPQIVRNYNRMQASPHKGNPVGMGLMMEGLCYNPVVFELLFDMMWGEGVQDLEAWKKQYVLKRYGKDIDSVRKAWDILYASRYTHEGRTGNSLLIGGPGLWDDSGPDMDIVSAWKLMLEAADELKDCPAYHFDLVNLGREAMGIYATHYSSLVKQAYEARDIAQFRKNAAAMIQYIEDYDRLMATDEHFLLGKWAAGARSWGQTEDEKNLLEWGAKRQITDWGGHIGGYAVKEWSGIVGDRSLPLWRFYLKALEKQLETGESSALDDYNRKAHEHLSQWPHQRTNLPATAQGDPTAVSREMWNKYGWQMWQQGHKAGYTPPKRATPPGIAVNKPITATDTDGDKKAEYAVDGEVMDRNLSWWSKRPASLTVDLQKVQKVLGFQVYPYWNGQRYYQYTIEVSVDGKTWQKAVDMSGNTQKATAGGHLHSFKITMPTGFTGRYVRLNMLKNSANPGVHVVEFKVFDGSEDIEE